MILKQLLWLACALCVFSITAPAQTSSASPSPTPTANAKSNSAETAKRAAIPPEKAKPIVIPRFDKPPVIDGKLDDEVWKQAAVFKDIYQINPDDNIAPSKPSEAMIGYDAKTYYLAFHCYDEIDKISATVAKRADVFGE